MEISDFHLYYQLVCSVRIISSILLNLIGRLRKDTSPPHFLQTKLDPIRSNFDFCVWTHCYGKRIRVNWLLMQFGVKSLQSPSTNMMFTMSFPICRLRSTFHQRRRKKWHEKNVSSSKIYSNNGLPLWRGNIEQFPCVYRMLWWMTMPAQTSERKFRSLLSPFSPQRPETRRLFVSFALLAMKSRE